MGESLGMREVAEILGVSVRTVQNYLKDGKLTTKKDETALIPKSLCFSGIGTKARKTIKAKVRKTTKTHVYNPENRIVLDRVDYENTMKKYDGALIRLGQLEAEGVKLLWSPKAGADQVEKVQMV